jgi:hypothetical protein
MELKPFVVEIAPCDSCDTQQTRQFCASVHCLRYLCDACWQQSHHVDSALALHKPMIKNAGDRVRRGNAVGTRLVYNHRRWLRPASIVNVYVLQGRCDSLLSSHLSFLYLRCPYCTIIIVIQKRICSFCDTLPPTAVLSSSKYYCRVIWSDLSTLLCTVSCSIVIFYLLIIDHTPGLFPSDYIYMSAFILSIVCALFITTYYYTLLVFMVDLHTITVA